MCVQRGLNNNLLHPNKGGFVEDCPCEAFQKAAKKFYSGSWIVLHEVEYWYFASYEYMIHDGDYYSIVDKDKTLSLLD